MHRCGRFIIVVNDGADGNPERNENAGEADQAEGNATRI